jgi:LacI family transcriptional regulator
MTPARSRRPTQRQIARQLGLSPATVSLALRDSPMIAADTRALVREAMREAGYVPNVVAASLRTGRSRIVGVSFHNIAHQFFAEMLIAIEESLTERGAAVLINNHGEDPESLVRFVETLAAYGADGLLVSPPPHVTAEVLAPLRRRGVPIVYVSRHIREDLEADRVINADHDAMRSATGRLVALGHRRLVLIGGETGTTVAEDRVAGFRAEVTAAGIPWSDDLWIRCRPRLIEGAAAAMRALDRDPAPTGVVCFNDLVAFGVMNAMRSRGFEPGRDIGLVALGGTDEGAAFHPPLTTVLDNPGKIGRLAAEILSARLKTPDAPPRHVTLEPRLVVRKSCGGPQAGT